MLFFEPRTFRPHASLKISENSLDFFCKDIYLAEILILLTHFKRHHLWNTYIHATLSDFIKINNAQCDDSKRKICHAARNKFCTFRRIVILNIYDSVRTFNHF